jgi:hypothetical protein
MEVSAILAKILGNVRFYLLCASLTGMRSRFKCYFCWLRRRLPQRMKNTPAEPSPCRLNIIFNLEMVQEIKDVKNKKSPGFEAFL